MNNKENWELNAPNRTYRFGALFLIISGIGILIYILISITTEQNSNYASMNQPAERNGITLSCEEPKTFYCGPPDVDAKSPAEHNGNNLRASVEQPPNLVDLAKNSTTIPLPDKDLRYAKYKTQPKSGSKIGSLKFIELKLSMPLIEGTGKKSLKKGAGHYVASVLPGLKDNSVVAGHRETVFKNLAKVKIGHRIVVSTSAGIFTYQVVRMRIVMASDKTVIVPTKKAMLTLVTCYPFKAYGPKPQRYIVSAELISTKK